MSSFVATAIAEVCAPQNGLLVVQVPSDMAGGFAEDLVRAANTARPSSPPYAILISEEDDLRDSILPRVSRTNAIQYRKDDRLACVGGNGVDLASFDGSYRQAVGPGFPAQQSQIVTLADLARVLLERIEAECGLAIDPSVAQICAEALNVAMDVVAGVLESSPEITESWNTIWYQHVERAIAVLVRELKVAATLPTSESMSEGFPRRVWTAFGLPQPSGPGLWDKRSAMSIVRAIKDWWGDGGQVEVTMAHVAATEPTVDWSVVEFSSYDIDSLAFRSTFRALQEAVTADRESFAAWGAMPQGLFERPITSDDPLSITSLDGVSLETAGVGTTAVLPLDGGDVWRSPEFLIGIAVKAVDTDDIDKLRLSIKPSYAELEVSGAEVDGHRLVVKASVRMRKRTSLKHIRVTLGVRSETDTHLVGRLNARAQASLTLVPSSVGALVFPQKKGGSLGTPAYCGPDKDEGEQAFIHDLDSGSAHVVVFWGGKPETSDLALSQLPERDGFHIGEVPPQATAQVAIGDTTFQLLSPEGDPRFETPLSAALTSEPHFRGSAPELAQQMVRGLYESWIEASDPSVLDTLGHCVMPVRGEGFDERALATEAAANLVAPQGFWPVWKAHTGFGVADELLGSKEFESFRGAAEVVLERLWAQRTWPSKVPWRSLSGEDSEVLDNYLTSYADLVGRASGMDRFTRFWACFPFSISVWDEGECSALLLSPLHPIRLAWLASAEATLFEATDNGAGLAGVVEGWAFPLIGPQPTPSGRLVAVPSDSGPREVFAAWSIMVPVSIDENKVLATPDRIMGQPAPGSSPSGLTASAAEAALRDFQRSHPHVPSLTIDLSASEDSPRLQEVDSAVLATIRGWKRQGGLRGVRVLDSLHRAGDLPRSELSKLIDDGGSVITWSRYRPKVGTSLRSNIRLLEDSGARIRVDRARLNEYQVAAKVPLRRFSAAELVSDGEAFSATVLAPTGWVPFDRAVNAIEGTPSDVQLGIKLTQSYLLDTGADWTVSGEAFLSPGSLGCLIAGQATGDVAKRVLWEWRPPYLQGSHGGTIERRPYVTVARVAPAMSRNLVEKLGEVAGGSDDQLQSLSFRVLERLGTRGLGLSSLFTRGDTHESGALGFYLAYELLDKVQPQDAIDVALPLDACDTFLEAMGGSKAGNASKRADLLHARIREDDMVLTPIEIKFYGADAAGVSHSLPHPGPALREAVGQAEATLASLRQALDRGNQRRGSADGLLWDTALATLIESGLRLNEKSHGNGGPRNTEVLQKIVSGDIAISLGKPVVLYFQHGEDVERGYTMETSLASAMGEYGCFIARPRRVFAAVDQDDNPNEVAAAWGDLIDWATSAATPMVERSHADPSEGSRVGGALVEEPEVSPRQPQAAFDEPTPARAVHHLADETTEASSGFSSSRRAAPVDAVTDAQTPEPVASRESRDPFIEPRVDGVRGSGIRFPLGTYRGSMGTARPEFWPSNTRLNQMNIGVAGDLGTGKTQLLKALVYQLRAEAAANQENPLSFLIFDYKRDFQDEQFLAAVGGRVLRPEDIPLNPLALRGPYTERAAYQVAVEFCDVLDRIYSGVGPVQRERLTTTILDLYKERQGQAPTLSAVLQRYREDGRPDSVTAILSNFVMRNVFIDDRGPSQSLDELLGDSVVVLAVNELGNDQDGKNSLVALFLNEYYGYMTRQTKWPFQGDSPQLRRLNSFLLVDEAVNILRYDFEVLMNLLLQGREYGVGVILSSQFLTHFRTRRNDWSEPLLTWFVHKVPSVTERDLDRVGIRVNEATAAGVGALEVHYALYKGLDEQGRIIRATPFYQLVRNE